MQKKWLYSAAFAVSLLLSGQVFAAEDFDAAPRTKGSALTKSRGDASLDVELVTRLTTGKMRTELDSSADTPQLGKPTSVLEYKDLVMPVSELRGTAKLRNGVFVRGKFAYGSLVGDGKQSDDDYFSQDFADSLGGPTRFSRTESKIVEARSVSGSFDVGLAAFRGNSYRFAPYVGAYYWQEYARANGIVGIEDPYAILNGVGQVLNNETAVLANRGEWWGGKVGLVTDIRLTDRLQLSSDLAFSPYSRYQSSDSHYVRSDLGPTPNFLDGGRGVGGEVDLSLNYAVTDAWDVGVSGNYKVMYGTGDASAVDVSGNNIEGGSSRLQNIRYGAGVNVGYHF